MIARVVAVLLGAGVVVYGAQGLVSSASFADLRSVATWFVGGALLSDLIIAPAVIATGVLLSRAVRDRVRPYVQAGLIMTGGVTLAALPLLTGRGKSDSNPSALPLNYPRGWLITVACVWAAVLLIALARRGWERLRH